MNPSYVALQDQADEQLMKLFYNGDRVAFDVLEKRYHKPLNDFIYNRVRDWDHVEDIAQEVWIKVFRTAQSGSRFDSTRRFRPWLLQIARNQYIDFTRRQRHEETPTSQLGQVESDVDGAASRADMVDTGKRPEELVELRELAQIALECLDEIDKPIIELRIEGYSNEETASRLGITRDQTAKRYSRALDKMWEKFVSRRLCDSDGSPNASSIRPRLRKVRTRRDRAANKKLAADPEPQVGADDPRHSDFDYSVGSPNGTPDGQCAASQL